MQKITPHLWFDKEAKEAAHFYTGLFPDSKVIHTAVLRDTPSGDVDVVTIRLSGQTFMLLSAGPLFRFTPAASFLVACTSKEEVDALWNELSRGGKTLMELGTYPFSDHYGWTEDRYGLSWQIMHMGNRPIQQKITPTLMFTESVAGKAEEAIHSYVSIFNGQERGRPASIGTIMRYNENEEPDRPGTVKHASFVLAGQEFAAMDSAFEHGFTFNEAISFIINCDDQAEIDYYWDRLSAVPEAEQCGWLKDRYGFSWQVVPSDLDKMMASSDPAKLKRITEAFLKMKKFDVAELRRIYDSQ